MSDFLSRLAGRQLGQIPVVEPRVASMFAAQPGDAVSESPESTFEHELDLENVAAHSDDSGPLETEVISRGRELRERPLPPQHRLVNARTMARMVELQQRPLPHPPSEVPKRVARAASASYRRTPTELPESLDLGGAKSMAPSSAERRFEVPARLVPVEDRTRVITPGPARRSPASRTSAGTAEPVSASEPEEQVRAPQVLPIARERRADRLRQVEESPVHVTIGRIEVTAVTAPPSAKRPAAPRRQATSLGDYLKQRERRDR